MTRVWQGPSTRLLGPALSEARKGRVEGARYAAARCSSKSAPPSGAFLALTEPPWRSMMARTMERPRPLPAAQRDSLLRFFDSSILRLTVGACSETANSAHMTGGVNFETWRPSMTADCST